MNPIRWYDTVYMDIANSLNAKKLQYPIRF